MDAGLRASGDYTVASTITPGLPVQFSEYVQKNQHLFEKMLANGQQVPIRLDMKDWELSTTTSKKNLQAVKEKVSKAVDEKGFIQIYPELISYTKDSHLKVTFFIKKNGSLSIGQFTTELVRVYPNKFKHLSRYH